MNSSLQNTTNFHSVQKSTGNYLFRAVGIGGVWCPPPQKNILADTLTLFQRGLQIMFISITYYPPPSPLPDFQTCLRPCYSTSIACEDCSFWQVLIPIILMDQALICLLKLLYILPTIWFPFNQLEVHTKLCKNSSNHNTSFSQTHRAWMSFTWI